MALSQRQVIERFLDHKSGRASNLSSDGVSLWSYEWWQMAQWTHADATHPDNVLVVRQGPSYSSSTTRQGSALRSVLAQHPDIHYVRSEPTPRSVSYMERAD